MVLMRISPDLLTEPPHCWAPVCPVGYRGIDGAPTARQVRHDIMMGATHRHPDAGVQVRPLGNQAEPHWGISVSAITTSSTTTSVTR